MAQCRAKHWYGMRCTRKQGHQGKHKNGIFTWLFKDRPPSVQRHQCRSTWEGFRCTRNSGHKGRHGTGPYSWTNWREENAKARAHKKVEKAVRHVADMVDCYVDGSHIYVGVEQDGAWDILQAELK